MRGAKLTRQPPAVSFGSSSQSDACICFEDIASQVIHLSEWPSKAAKIQTETPAFSQNFRREPCTLNRNGAHCANRASAERLGLAAHPRVELVSFVQNSSEPNRLR